MNATELTSLIISWDPDIDLGEIDVDLPGKHVVSFLRDALSKTQHCGDLIAESHGWCFYASQDYLRFCIELVPVLMDDDGKSRWVLLVKFEPLFRFWQYFRSGKAAAGASLLSKSVSILVASDYGFIESAQQVDAPDPGS